MKLRWPYLFFPLTFLFLLYFAFTSRGIYDTGDGVMHHLIARYSFQHPELFLHHWGKPLYTLLSSPFAQFGYTGSVVFNIICLCSSAWLAWKTAERLKIPFAFLAAPLCIFAPIALPVGMSGLTEPLFALVLIAGVYFSVQGKFNYAAIVISFLPFARTEGFFLAALFAVYFLLRGGYLAIALLALGSLLYSIIGYFHYHDLLWVIDENPYKGAKDIYGEGSFWHFIALNEFIWGWALTGLLVLGILFYALSKKLSVSISKAEALLIPGMFLFFLLLHSIFWWKGLFGSLGLHRVMATTIPLAVLISLRGLQLIFMYVKNQVARVSMVSVILVLQVFLTIRQHPLPLQKSHDQLVTDTFFAAENPQRISPPVGKRIFCAYPYAALVLKKDPFDETQWEQPWGLVKRTDFKKDEWIIWDSHFAKTDVQLPLEEIENDPRFEKIAETGEMPLTKDEGSRKFLLVFFRVK